MSCSNCFETIFEGSNFCPLCGAKAVSPERTEDRPAGKCPRCRSGLTETLVSGARLDECDRCGGVWCDVDTFESICSEKERQAAVIQRLRGASNDSAETSVRYVPCPVCSELMNRSNFAKVSGIVIDTCRPHGMWFDARELPGIIEFIDKGGMDLAREKEKLKIAEERSRLKQEQFSAAVDRFKGESGSSFGRTTTTSAIREFINFLSD